MKKLLIASLVSLTISACSPVPAIAAEASASAKAAYVEMLQKLNNKFVVVDDEPYFTDRIESTNLHPAYVECAKLTAKKIDEQDSKTAEEFGMMSEYQKTRARMINVNTNMMLRSMEKDPTARKNCLKVLDN